MPIAAIAGSGIPRSHLPFAPAVRAGDFIFVSGQASVDDGGALVPDTFEGEMRRSVANVARILAAAGSGLDAVIQVRGYVGREADLGAYNRLYAELFTGRLPARTTLVGCLGAALKFEVDVVAYVGV
jgi:2-iminobutanoate/2-iminopropanoate deaminase